MSENVSLVCHPETPCRVLQRLVARVKKRQGVLTVGFILEGEIARLRTGRPRKADPLWRHTCCEIFVGRPDTPAYREFNVSPAGRWAAYAFTDYRQGRPRADAISLLVRPSPHKLELEARVNAPGRVRLGLSAVIEDEDGTLSYWALRHPPGKPDFHHPDAFALELEDEPGS